MTDDYQPTPRTVANSGIDQQPDGGAAAFVAAITAGIKLLCSLFRGAATETAASGPVDRAENFDAFADEPAEIAIRRKYANATLHWNQLNARARALGIAFSPRAQAHHRAAILDALEDPFAPTMLNYRHLTYVILVDSDGYNASHADHPAARALYRRQSQIYPSIHPPERNDWTDAQWRDYFNRESDERLARLPPEGRERLRRWSEDINRARDAGTDTSWRAPGYHGPRRRSGHDHG